VIVATLDDKEWDRHLEADRAQVEPQEGWEELGSGERRAGIPVGGIGTT
jgi:hypothetical protein